MQGFLGGSGGGDLFSYISSYPKRIDSQSYQKIAGESPEDDVVTGNKIPNSNSYKYKAVERKRKRERERL